MLAFVYFAGHGFTTKRDSFEYLMPVDGDLLDPMTNINRATFCTLLRSAPQFAKLFLITDCCRTVYVVQGVCVRTYVCTAGPFVIRGYHFTTPGY